MKILFYCNSIFSYGGVQRVLAVIAKSLSASHEVTILTQDQPESEDKTIYGLNDSAVRFDYIRYPALAAYEWFPCKLHSFLYKKILPGNKAASFMYANTSFPPTYQKILIHKIRQGNYDIVIGVHAFLSLHLACIQNKIKAKTIGWMHNSYQAFFEMKSPYLKNLKYHFSHQMARLDRVVVLSHSDAELYEKHLHLHPQVIYNPLTLSPQGKGNAEHKKFLAVGRFSPRHKGFDILVESFSIFAQNNTNWTLDIIGEGPEAEFLHQLIRQKKLEERITIYPFTQHIQRHYASASVYILSSRWEGLPLVLMEAMSHSLPVIASDIPIVKEILSGNKGSLLFKSEDTEQLARKMEEITQTDLNELGRQAEQYAATFHIQHILPQWQKLLSELR